MDAPSTETERPAAPSPADRRKGDRRQGERRGMEALRAEALQNVIARVEDRNFGGIKNRVNWGRGGKAPRIMLLLVASVAGGAAAFMAMQRDQVVTPAQAKPTTEVVQEARTQILVAKQEIGVGERVSIASLGWEDWPQDAVRPEYITYETQPEALTSVEGTVARVAIYPGEPIREQKLMAAGEGGQLSAVLEAGTRGVSVIMTADSASGGFIVPNDRVDVLLTREAGEDFKLSQTILENVRVLAINAQIGDKETDEETVTEVAVFDQAIATLALNPTQAEVIVTAQTLGRLSMVLRPMADGADPKVQERQAANQAIRMSSPFWTK